jgi:hypothetical protein
MLVCLQVVSDLHLELEPGRDFTALVPRTAPFLVLAGDIGRVGDPALEAFMGYVARTWDAAYYILGNHEFYSAHATMDSLLEKYAATFPSPAFPNVFLVHNAVVTLPGAEGATLAGSTLWTACDTPLAGYNDFRCIKEQPEPGGRKYGLSVGTLQALHAAALEFLKSPEARTASLVVTHFSPDDPREASPYWHSTVLRDLAAAGGALPPLWLHGHTHVARDDVVAGVRVVSNPVGTSDEATGHVPGLVVAVGTTAPGP